LHKQRIYDSIGENMDKPRFICSCGKELELEELLSNEWDDYAAKCECGLIWQMRDVTEEYNEELWDEMEEEDEE